MDEDWIEWTGGECPVSSDTIVETRFADGFVPNPREAIGSVIWRENWEWTNDGDEHRIVAYRIIKEPTIGS